MTSSTANILDPVTMPLNGKHLIEASAGTGKTFNITRIFLRTLLEKKLPIEQILVMTFSNAATEEIRGRVAETLIESIDFWERGLSGEDISGGDPVFAALFARFGDDHALAQLKAASLVIDEASIFTIHGFCQYVLSMYAFETGVALNSELHTDNTEWLETATKDWFRAIDHNSQALTLLIEMGWHTPERFLSVFRKAVDTPLQQVFRHDDALAGEADVFNQTIATEFEPRFKSVFEHLNANVDVLYPQLVEHKTPATQLTREGEWQALNLWLQNGKPELPEKAVDKIISGSRYPKKEHIKALIEPIKALKTDLKKALEKAQKTLERQQQQQPAIELVEQGIRFIREKISEYKTQFALLEFDDLVMGVADAVTSNPDLARKLEAQYPVALVDEFQDTDSAQYRLLERVYQNPALSTLMMIGDPKQAIYGFRGGDIFTYLQASRHADYLWYMNTNWRSTSPMVDAYNHVFNHAKFDFDIQYLAVNSTPHAKANGHPLIDNAADVAKTQALQFVYCHNGADEKAAKGTLREQQAAWLTNEIQRLFCECRLGEREVESKDIAILVRSATEADVIADALQQAGITYVYMSNQQSVFSSYEAQDVLKVLRGIYHHSDQRAASAALTSPLFGFHGDEQTQLFVDQNDESWDQALAKLFELKRLWLADGVLAVLQRLIDEHLHLHSLNPERQLTNYQHLAERLQAQAESGGMREPDKLIDWLYRQILRPQGGDEGNIQRLEKDENAVQIITQHKSKGLEYPIVFIPFASDYRDAALVNRSPALVCQFYNEQHGTLLQQIGDTHEAHQRMRREGEAEATRLLYVAITRAAHRCYIMLSPFKDSHKSAIGVALSTTDEAQWQNSIALFSAQNPYCSWHNNDQRLEIHALQTTSQSSMQLAELPATRINQNDWRLLSFSALTSADHSWNRSRSDEGDVSKQPDTVNESVFALFPKGAGPGNVLHDILEKHDFTQADWDDEAAERIIGLTKLVQPDDVLDWLDDALAMPISLSDDNTFSLNQLAMDKTLREAEFYFPLNEVDIHKFNGVIAKLRGKTTAGISFQKEQLDGMMHGFIDLIFEYDGRYYVADYKSTYMGAVRDDYHPDLLADNMQSHNYDVQALIYSLALHRYLQRSKADYLPEKHFGGALYLYLRGMSSENQQNEGAISLPITIEVLEQLDALFAGEVA